MLTYTLAAIGAAVLGVFVVGGLAFYAGIIKVQMETWRD